MNALRPVETVLLLGGTSEIGLAIVRRLVDQGARRVLLAGRDRAALERAGAALAPASVEVIDFDATDTASHEDFVEAAFAWAGGDLDLALLAFGILGDQELAEDRAGAAIEVLRTNFEGVVSIAVPLAKRMRGQGHGHLVLLSSVAGERARRANFVYGASKAGADTFFQGLVDSLTGTGVHAMVVRPGRVRTRMTTGLPEVPLTTDPERVAADTIRGLARGAHTVWSPPVVRPLMFALRLLPRPLYRRVTERA